MKIALLLLCSGAIQEQTARPNVPVAPVIPTPIPSSPYNCRLYTDWAPVTRSKQPVWRYAKRVEGTDTWEETECGRAGSRFRASVARSDDTITHATTGRRLAGDGGIGAGFEWKVYVGDAFDARLDFEFTPTGPRMILGVTYWPKDGREVALGWSVLSGEFVQRHGWSFEAGEVWELWFWRVQVPVMQTWRSLRDPFR